MASNSCETTVMPSYVLLDHEARLEEVNPEATRRDRDECLEGMELAVYNAAKEGNIDALSKHRERLHQILTPTRNTVLHIYIACAMSTDPNEVDSPATVKKMLEMCPSLLEQSNKIGDTAIHIAARYGLIAIVDAIMQVVKMDRDGGGAAWPRILSTTNEEGNTALHEAVRFNHIHVVRMLITEDDHHQTLYSANVAGETPLYLAAERGYYDLVCEIVNSFTDPAYQGPSGRTALHAAVIRNDEDEFNELKDSHLVAATLIATVSFAAGFTMPGGYQGDKGSDQGSAVLSRNAAFQAFVITNTIAMTLSSCSVLLHLYSIVNRKRKVMTEASFFLYIFTMLALIAMVIAFITGTYAVLGHHPRLGITVCVLGCVLFFVFVEFTVYDERGIMETNLPLLPLSLSFFFCLWLLMKMLHVIRKLCYHCLPASKGKRSNRIVANRSSSLVCPKLDRQMIVYQQC